MAVKANPVALLRCAGLSGYAGLSRCRLQGVTVELLGVFLCHPPCTEDLLQQLFARLIGRVGLTGEDDLDRFPPVGEYLFQPAGFMSLLNRARTAS